MSKKITKFCEACGRPVTRYKSEFLTHVFCSRSCSKEYLSKKMTRMNIELNPTRMTKNTREKLRNARLGKGEGKSYEKYYGAHTHRVIAEKLIGRKLKPGEVVHHIDQDKHNNSPDNLMVFRSQREHAAWHAAHKRKEVTTNEI